MNKLFFHILFVLVCFSNSTRVVFAQADTDSLENVLISVTDSAKKTRIAQEICWKNRSTDPQKALRYALIAEAYSENEKEPAIKARSYSYMGIVFRNLGNYTKAIECYFKALRILETSNDEFEIAYSYNNIGEIYRFEKEYELATNYIQKALLSFEKIKDKKGLAYAYLRWGEVNQDQGKYDSAIHRFQIAQKLRQEFKDIEGYAYIDNKIGQIYLQWNFPQLAEKYFTHFWHIADSLNNNLGRSEAKIGIAKMWLAQKKYELATQEIRTALHYAQKASAKQQIRTSYNILSTIYSETGNYKDAFYYQKLEFVIADSILNQDKIRNIASLQSKFDEDYRKAQIDLLTKKKEVNEAIIKRQTIISYGLMAIIGMAIVFSIILYRNILKRKEANRSLRKQRNEVLDKNIQIEKQSVLLKQINDELNTTISELKSTQTQLVQSEKMASLGQLTAGIAHEINNPINFVFAGIDTLEISLEDLMNVFNLYLEADFTNAETLPQTLATIAKAQKKYPPKEVEEDIKNLIGDIRTGAERTIEIVKGLRNFSRTDEAEKKRANIHQGIDSTLIILKTQYKGRIDIIKNYAPQMPDIECYPGQLNQVLMNILANAIQAIEGQGKIEITTNVLENTIVVSIKDSGAGIPDNVKQRIFEPFFTTKEVGKGTGLGLSISYGIIQKHRGAIEVFSEEGKGTEFIITLQKEL